MLEVQPCHHDMLLQYLCQLCSLLAANSWFPSQIMGKNIQHPLSWEQSFPEEPWAEGLVGVGDEELRVTQLCSLGQDPPVLG